MKIPHDAERLMDELPQAILDEIQFEMIIFSGLSFLEMGSSEPSKKQFKNHMQQTMNKHIGLLKKAKNKLNNVGGV